VSKGPDAFRTISEAADEVGVPQHVLRFWETKFTFIRAMKRAGGRRFYRPQDLIVLRGVRALLHEDGYTIRGVQQLHRDSGVGRITAAGERAPGRAGRLASAAIDGDASAPGGAVEGVSEPPAATSTLSAGVGDVSGLDGLLADLEAAKARLDSVLGQG
jgi:DNA-binding transcriptional MerR regulator